VTRGGIAYDYENLSRGTQELLALFNRIEFADMMLEQSRPVFLTLDDPLVYSYDRRLDAMKETLTQTAPRMQVILLTCSDRVLRHIPGIRISLGSQYNQSSILDRGLRIMNHAAIFEGGCR